MQDAYAVQLIVDEPGRFRVHCRDLPGLITWAETEAAALVEAEDALEVLIGSMMEAGEAVPLPSPAEPGEHLVAPPALIAAKLPVYRAWRESGMSKSELARRLGVGETEVRRILGPSRSTRIERLDEAARVLGKRLTFGTVAA